MSRTMESNPARGGGGRSVSNTHVRFGDGTQSVTLYPYASRSYSSAPTNYSSNYIRRMYIHGAVRAIHYM